MLKRLTEYRFNLLEKQILYNWSNLTPQEKIISLEKIRGEVFGLEAEKADQEVVHDFLAHCRQLRQQDKQVTLREVKAYMEGFIPCKQVVI